MSRRISGLQGAWLCNSKSGLSRLTRFILSSRLESCQQQPNASPRKGHRLYEGALERGRAQHGDRIQHGTSSSSAHKKRGGISMTRHRATPKHSSASRPTDSHAAICASTPARLAPTGSAAASIIPHCMPHPTPSSSRGRSSSGAWGLKS